MLVCCSVARKLLGSDCDLIAAVIATLLLTNASAVPASGLLKIFRLAESQSRYTCKHLQTYIYIYIYIYSGDYTSNHVGGCQNYGPFVGPFYNTRGVFRGPKRGL